MYEYLLSLSGNDDFWDNDMNLQNKLALIIIQIPIKRLVKDGSKI